MDDVIYEEFKGTGNTELHLDRRLAERRIFPALDIVRSGTRSEELMMAPETLSRVWTLRRMIDMLRQTGEDPLEPVLERLRRTRNNKAFLETLSQSV